MIAAKMILMRGNKTSLDDEEGEVSTDTENEDIIKSVEDTGNITDVDDGHTDKRTRSDVVRRGTIVGGDVQP